MTTQVLDSTDLPAILADAGVVSEGDANGKEETHGKESSQANDGAANNSGRSQDSGRDGGNNGETPDPDDIEGEDGLTPRQKREFTANMQKTIGKKHRMLREAEEFAAAQYNERKLAEQRAAAAERELQALKGKNHQVPASDPKAQAKPDRQNFATEAEYIDAMIGWGVDQRMSEQRAREAQEAAERAQAQIIETARGRISKAMELVPDYRETVEGVDMEVPPVIAGYMQKSELFAELGYHLAKNPDLLVSLAKLPPDEQLVKIGKIESILSPFGAQSAPDGEKPREAKPNGQPSKAAPSAETGTAPSKPRGNVAPVITPLEVAGSAGAPKEYGDMNTREMIADYAKRNRVNLGMRKRH